MGSDSDSPKDFRMLPFTLMKSVTSFLFYCSVATMLLVILPGIPPYVKFRSFKLTPQRVMEGKLAPNFILDKAEVLVEGQFLGAESIVVQENVLYTAVTGGDVLKIQDQRGKAHVRTIGRTREPCDPDGVDCTRPLGVRMDAQRNLVIADAYEGIVSMNLKTGTRTKYFSMEDEIEGEAPKLANDLDIGKDGSVYWSDMSSTFHAHEFALKHIGTNTGRLIRYDPRTKNNSVLLSNLFVANGVQLSEKEDYVLVSESFKARVLRYYLKGPKAGTQDVFLDGLPGFPDNIRPNGRGGYFITLCWNRSPMADDLGPLPQLRKLLFRLQWFALTGLSTVERVGVFDDAKMSNLIATVANMGNWGFNYFSKASILDVDSTGNILAWYRTDTSKAFGITQFTAGKTHAYFSSMKDDKIFKISLEALQRK